ncbi:MAG: SpoIID/LytB domain-containing protein [Agathobacter sp.]|nr:SpoIID/LytB domain-containing protein [Agathobacter sp.]
MKGIFKKKITLVILLLTVISLIFTGVILAKMVKDTSGEEQRAWFFEESIQTGQPVVLENAYIISNDGNKLTFLYDYKNYEVDGNMSQEYTGIGDIHIDGEKVSKISIKPDSIKGVLQSYTEGELVLKEHGIERKNTSLPIYQLVDGQVKQREWTQMIIGVSNIQCVMEKGVVCGIILQEDIVPSDIRVLMKNGSDIFRSQVYVKKKSDDSIIHINQYMSDAGLTTYTLEDANGMMLCDAQGNETGALFEGKLHFYLEPQGIVLVNELPMELYLKYVLPSEMPKSFGEEALKAQAVCARTYAYTHMNNQSYAKYGANVDNTTSFQAYHNTHRTAETDAAVDGTIGEVATCNGELISCYYFSTSPGVTNNTSSWGGENREYIACAGLEFSEGLDLTKDSDFSRFMTQQEVSYDAVSNYYRWKAVLDISTIHDSEKGALKDITVKKRNEAGYVTELELAYENTTEVLMHENKIRKVLGAYLQEVILQNEQVRTDLSMIPSACFEVLVNTDGQIVLRGGGNGHGIGMSQYGARGMAEKGYNYKEIIDYYFENVVIKKI